MVTKLSTTIESLKNMKILYIMSSYNIYGGTPKKTLDLLNYFKKDSALYVYSDSYQEFKILFEQTEASIYEGNYGKNLFKHINALLRIIDKENIDIVQTQFTMGEILGGIIKKLRPHIKLIIAFVGSSSPTGLKKYLISKVYNDVDAFVYISNYVKQEKVKAFSSLSKQFGKVIYNGIRQKEVSLDGNQLNISHPALFDIAGLTEIKNIDVLIDAIEILKKRGKTIHLYIAGDGPKKMALLEKIETKHLGDYIHLLGYRTDTEIFLNDCDIFVHPCYVEGFGIAVAEAMMAAKPVIVANSGALPELIENNKSGLAVDPFNANVWAEAILKLIEDKNMADEFGKNAKEKAHNEFSSEKYVFNYYNLYTTLMEQK